MLIREAGGSFVLRTGAVGLGFLTTFLLARLIGAAQLGAYRYAMSWNELLLVVTVMGMHRLLVREVASYAALAQWGRLSGLIRRSHQIGTLTAWAVFGIGLLVLWIFEPFTALQREVILVSLVLLPFKTLIRLRQAVMQGFSRVVYGQLPELLYNPLLFIGLILVGYFLLPDSAFNATSVMVFQIVATFVAFLVGVRMLRQVIPDVISSAMPEYQTRQWLLSSLPLLLVNGIVVINTQSTHIILGMFHESVLVGIYAVVNQGAALIIFVYQAANNSLAPAFARLYAQGDLQRLQRLATDSSRAIFLSSLPIALPLIVFGTYFLSLFGARFTDGQTALVILCCGQLFNAATGSGGWLLIMTGHEREAAWGTGIAALLNVGACLVLIPRWGLSGAAMASTLSLTLQNIILVWYCRRKLGIHATALGNFGLWRLRL